MNPHSESAYFLNPLMRIFWQMLVEKEDFLIHVDLATDLNNDGKIDQADKKLRDAAFAKGSSALARQKGTEYVFFNDTLSNGATDNAEGDDDVEEIDIDIPHENGAVWLDAQGFGYSNAKSLLKFYKTRKCKADDLIKFPYDLEANERLPKRIYMGVEGDKWPNILADTQQFGVLLKWIWGKSDQSIIYEETKIYIEVINQLRAKNYFDAARDYIYEKNVKKHVRLRKPGGSNDAYVISFAEENLTMEPLYGFSNEASNPAAIYNIGQAVKHYSDKEVIINAQLVYSAWDIIVDKTKPFDPYYVKGEFVKNHYGQVPPSDFVGEYNTLYLGFSDYPSKIKIRANYFIPNSTTKAPEKYGLGQLPGDDMVDTNGALVGVYENQLDRSERMNFILYSKGLPFKTLRADANKSGLLKVAGEEQLVLMDPGSAFCMAYKKPEDSKLDNNSIVTAGRYHTLRGTVYSYLLFDANSPRKD